MSTSIDLFTPVRFGSLELAHRIVMSPLTRMRSTQPGNIPNDLMALQYRQRATPGGLLIAEATQVMPEGQGYPGTPGVHSAEQVEGWRKVTGAVHEMGGKMALQLWHVGRISHSSQQPNGGLPVAPSAIAPRKGITFTADWQQVPFETPRALETAELPGIVEAYRQGAVNAKAAGFDAVEVHSANGYLLDQFLQDGTNKRTDAYGGSLENRTRLLLEVVDAVAGVWGTDRVGVRLSPFGTFNDMEDSDSLGLFTYVIERLSERRLAYLHLIEPRSSETSFTGELDLSAPNAAALFRRAFQGSLLLAGGFNPESAQQAVRSGAGDAIAFGRAFISNPDLVERIRIGAALTPWDRTTFYGGTEKGYTDYAPMGAVAARA